MTTALFSHQSALNHVTPDGHPERVARIEAINQALNDDKFNPLDRREAPSGDRADVLRCHPESYLERIEA
ncbi:MAG: histone deacetylase family protein, partial [Boseongicola sp.]